MMGGVGGFYWGFRIYYIWTLFIVVFLTINGENSIDGRGGGGGGRTRK